MATSSPSLLSELRRRSVFRVAVMYGIVAWLLIQVASIVTPLLHLPGWFPTFVVVLMGLGFPIALVLAWAYELTPGGVRRTPSRDALPHHRPPAQRHRPGASRPVPRPGLAGAIAFAAGTSLLAAAVWMWSTDHVGRSAQERRLDPRRVVVAVFENQTGDTTYNPLGHFATDYITEGLAGTDFAEPIDARGIPGVWRDSTSDPAVVRRLAVENRAGTVVRGRIYLDGDSIRFVAQIADAHDGRLLRSVEPVAAPRSSVEPGVERLRERVLTAIAATVGPWLNTFEPRSKERLPSFAAYRAYSAGMDAYTQGDYLTAAGQFEQAAAIDTIFLPARIWAALSHYLAAASHLSKHPGTPHVRQARQVAQADSIAAEIGPRRDRLGPYDQHFFDFYVAFRRGDAAAHYEAAKRMVQAAPGSVNARKELAYSAANVLRPRESLRLLEELNPERRLSPELSSASYWGWLVWCPHALGDYRAELRNAHTTREHLPQLFPVADVKALVALGRPEEAERLLEQRGDSVSGPFLLFMGLEMRAHGHAAASRRTLLRALAWIRAQPAANPGTRDWRNAASLEAGALFALGQVAEARSLYAQLASDDSLPAWDARGHLGVIAARAGQREAARRIYAGLLADTFLVAQQADELFIARAAVATALGDRDAAVLHLNRSFHAAGWNAVHRRPDLFATLRGYPPFETLMRPKG